VVADCIGMAAGLLSCFVAMCVDTCRFATGCCETHCNGCMKVARALFWGGSRSTKPYLPCAAGAAGVVLVSPLCSATSGCSCVRSEKCEVWTVKCEVWSVKCGALRAQYEVKCGVRRVQCEV